MSDLDKEISRLAAKYSTKFAQMENPAAIQIVLETLLRNAAAGKPPEVWSRFPFGEDSAFRLTRDQPS